MAYDGPMATAAPRKPASVGSEVERQVNSVCALEKCVEELEQRLLPILSNNPRATSGRPESGQEPPCAMASALASTNGRLDNIQSRLSDVLGRIEI